MNAHVRDNLNAVKTPAGSYNSLNLGADVTTNSTSFVDADATNLIQTFTTAGGDVLVYFCGCVVNSLASGRTYFDVHESVAGIRYGGDDGLFCVTSQSSASPVNASFCVRITGLSAASHAFKLQWKVSAGTTTMHAGAATASFDLHPQFHGFEL
jgi:hypothetical protein